MTGIKLEIMTCGHPSNYLVFQDESRTEMYCALCLINLLREEIHALGKAIENSFEKAGEDYLEKFKENLSEHTGFYSFEPDLPEPKESK